MRVRCILRDCLRSFDRLYTYEVPFEMQAGITAGCLVQVPFGTGNRQIEAYVSSIEEMDAPAGAGTIKELSVILSDGPVIRDDQLRLAAFMRE
ncbi:MAG TPA: hypothetical protein VIL27_10555, partial [Clostridia bacterium]